MSSASARPGPPPEYPERADACTCVLDLTGVVTWASAGARVVLGQAPVPGRPFAGLWLDQAAMARAVGEALTFGRSGFCGRPSGRDHGLEVALELRRDGQGAPVEVLAVIASRGTEGTALDAYQALFEAVPVVMWATHDRDAMVIVGNPLAEKRYNFSSGANQSLSQPPETIQNAYRYFLGGRQVEPSRLPMQRAAKGEHVRDEAYDVHFRDGRVNHVILNASPIQNAHGDIVGAVAVEIDITKRRRIEEAQARLLECSRATGQAFFDALVRAIGETLGARTVYIAETMAEDPRALHTLAAYIDGKPGTYGDFIPRETPCADVLATGGLKYVASGVSAMYPNAPILRELGAESYIGAPLRAFDGQILGIIGVAHDGPMDDVLNPVEIVEIFAGRAASEIQRERIEASLRRSERDSRIITDAVPALIAFIDNKQCYQYANAAYRRWFGFNPSDLKDRTLWDVLGREAYLTMKPYVEVALRGEPISFEVIMPYKVGPPRHVQAQYLPHIQDGAVQGFFAFVNEIGHLKEQEEALRKSEEQFRTLFEHLPVGAALVDQSGSVILENDVFCRLMPGRPGDGKANVFERNCTAHLEDGSLLPDAEHPVRRALNGVVARGVEFLCRYAQDGRQMWVRMSGVPIRDDHGRVTGALVVVADINSEKRAEDRRTLLINELNHRVKNTLASVQSIATQTFRFAQITEDGLSAFESRLLALSNAHDLLTRESWEGAGLMQLAQLVLEPHDPGADRLVIKGPDVRMRPAQALAFAMALHELATNAVKYGALSNAAGQVHLTWNIVGLQESRRLLLRWEERGGPTVAEPQRKGFGSRLIERSLAFELGSDTGIEFRREGVVCRMDADLAEIGRVTGKVATD